MEGRRDHFERMGDTDPIAIADVRDAAPWWPYGVEGTRRLIRRGSLGAIAIGRRRFVTVRLLRDFLERHTITPLASERDD